MKALKFFGLVVVVLFGAFMTFNGYMGGFRTITVDKQTFAATEIIYSTHLGPYERLHESWTKFSDEITEAGLTNCDGFGIYLDPPDTPPEKLRSIIACGVGDLTPEIQQTLKAKFPSFTLPSTEVFASSFPFKNMMSYFMGPSKVYPKFQELIKTGEITPSVSIEAYGPEKGRNKILYYMPIDISSDAYSPLQEAFNNAQ